MDDVKDRNAFLINVVYLYVFLDFAYMQIEDKLEEIRARYKRFCKKGGENLLTLKMDVEKLLGEAKETGAYNVVES